MGQLEKTAELVAISMFKIWIQIVLKLDFA
jgi:hypothetical protein